MVDEEFESDPQKLWVEGEREFYYNLPTNAPITGFFDTCSMFLDLSCRRLRDLSLPHYIKSGSYLIITHLHLQNNKLRELPGDVFTALENLMYLDARNNDLESFPVLVRGHEGLETILLQDNLIEEFPIELGSLEGLKTLAIEFNPMQFPSYTVFKQWRNKADVVDFFKRCWKEQSRTVSAVVKSKAPKLFKPKKPRFVQVKDHSEIVCDLKKSNSFRNQKLGDKLKNVIQSREKAIQKSKDKAVLKDWQETYRKYKNVDRVVVIDPAPYGRDDNCAKANKGLKYKLDVDQEILGIKQKLNTIGSETVFKDPESEMATRLREIKAIKKLQKKIEHLKYKT